MKISIVCSDVRHPVFPLLQGWCRRHQASHSVSLVSKVSELPGGDLLFLISCSEIVPASVRQRYGASLVIHASDLPNGRGWSPMVWQIIEGRSKIAVSLLEAEDKVDTGRIWQQRWLDLDGTELFDELNAKLFAAELDLMDFAVQNFGNISPQAQGEDNASYYPRRTPEDSRIDPTRPLAEQFDLLRVADPTRYPAFFDFRGERYEISIRKKAKED